MPWGYWTATLSAYGSNYYQQIAGINTTFVSSGESQNVDLKLHRVLRRSQNDVFGAQVRLTRRFGRSFIEDTEIPQQHRNNTIIELGVTDRHDFGEARFDATLSFRQGIGAFGAQADTVAAGDGPTWRFRMAVLDANLSVPFRIAGQRFRYVTAFRGQFTHDRLYYIDDLTIGSRYTVRGFDGESQLAGQRGFYWRNELQVPFGGRGPFRDGHTLYAGVDYGRVHRLSAARLVGRRPGAQLAGAVVGMRGGLGSRLGGVSYGLSVGVPVYKPKAFHTRWCDQRGTADLPVLNMSAMKRNEATPALRIAECYVASSPVRRHSITGAQNAIMWSGLIAALCGRSSNVMNRVGHLATRAICSAWLNGMVMS